MKNTPAQILTEIKREIAMRRKCYPRWVAEGKIAQATADHRISIFEDLRAEFQARVDLDNDMFADSDPDGGVFDPGTVQQ